MGAIGREAFRQLIRELREVAAHAPNAREPEDAPRWTQVDSWPSREQLIVGRYAAIYQTDHVAGTVLVTDVIRVAGAVAP